MILEKKNFSDLSSIKIDILTGEDELGYGEIMVIKCSGEYRFGSAGNGDAQYMQAMGKAALVAWEPLGAVLDWTGLSYEWGDMLDQVLLIGKGQCDEEPFPLAVVVGPQCEEAVRTLLLGIDSKEPIDKVEWVFRDLNSAWEYIETKIKKRFVR